MKPDDKLSLESIAADLDRFFEVDRYPGESNGIFRHGDRPIERLGLALEPGPGLSARARELNLDALFLHRPWTLPPDALAEEVGILAYHLPFDEKLTIGYNPRLADAFGLRDLEILGRKQDRAIGLLAISAPLSFLDLVERSREIFGGYDRIVAPVDDPVARVAIVGAMNGDLINEASDRGAEVYVTGQWRNSAREAIEKTGIGVIVTGHGRAERWGLLALAGYLRERWANLEVYPIDPN
jgi:putative NIF3 family GTP cyclohydrolase 1 type 2